jgi:hypothetical protein
MVIWYVLSRFGLLYQEKSGNPVWETVTGLYALMQMQQSRKNRIFQADQINGVCQV